MNSTAMTSVGSWHQLTVTVTVGQTAGTGFLPSFSMHYAPSLPFHIRSKASCPQDNTNSFASASMWCKSWYCAAQSKEQFFKLHNAPMGMKFGMEEGTDCTKIYHITLIVWRVRGKNYQVCSVQYCVQQLCTVQCIHIWTDLTVVWIRFCLTGPISLCLDSFLYFVYCMHV